MKRVSLSKEKIHNGSLILVNREYPLYEKFYKKRLAYVGCKKSHVLLEQRTAAILQNLLDNMNCEEEIIPVSGYRSEHEQSRIFESSMLDNGMEFTTKYVMPPNHSEHQSGLAIDLALNQPDIDFLCPYFPYTGICKTFRKKALRFGFIERYPQGKEKLTGIAHEPWHLRYVGAPHSKIMQEMDVTLEEYLLMLKGFPYGGEPLKYTFDGADIEIFYLEARQKESSFEIEDDLPYTISGDNMGGFIITIWRKANG